MTDDQKSKVLTLTALLLGALSIPVPFLALPALFAAMMGLILLSGRRRLIGGVLGGLLAFIGFVGFLVDHVAPNIVAAGQRSAEDKAVSRLRTVLWAEERALELGIVKHPTGEARAATLDELSEIIVPGGSPLLLPTMFIARTPGVRRVDGYLFAFHPAPGPGTRRKFIGYAWPEGHPGGGRRAFFIDSDDRICETPNADGRYLGDKAPKVHAALQAEDFDAPGCGTGSDGQKWLPWKGKKARTETSL